jgi:hypothetical protein
LSTPRPPAARLPLLADPAVIAAIADARLGRFGQVEVAAPGGARWCAVRAVPADPLVLVYLEETTARHAAAPAKARRPLSVLLVEDDPAVRSRTRRMLVALGHEVTTVSSGAEALA